MSILSWILVGLVAGLLAGMLQESYGPVESIIVAVVGAIIGGWLFAALSGVSVTLFSPAGAITSLIGSVVFVAAAIVLTRGRTAI